MAHDPVDTGDPRAPGIAEDAPELAEPAVVGQKLAPNHACDDSGSKFARDLVAVWTKVMNADRFDLAA